MNDPRIARKVALKDLAGLVAELSAIETDSDASGKAQTRLRADPRVAVKAQANVAPARLISLDRHGDGDFK